MRAVDFINRNDFAVGAIDVEEIVLEMTLEDDLELVNFPTVTEPDYVRDYKVMQLYMGQRPVMIFGRFDRQHFEILRDFLEDRKMSFDTIDFSGGAPSMGGGSHPYRVAGSGRAYINVDTKQFNIPEGCSTFYPKANPRHSAIFERRMLRDGWTKIR